MINWFRQWRATFLIGALVLGIASLLALATTVSTIAVNQNGSKPKVATPKQVEIVTKASPAPSPKVTPRQKKDGGEICKRFGSYAEAKRYYDAHPADRKALSWDGDARPCEDFLAKWR
jgi:hypothetical protein